VELREAVRALRPAKAIVTEPGEWRVRQAIQSAVEGTKIEIRADRHFYSSSAEFEMHAATRKQLRMEYFYREMRVRHNVLMDGKEPADGTWNLDKENRKSFGKRGHLQRLTNIEKASIRRQADAIRGA
jgi:deoxyribodipyrimidine photolyase-related protein